MNTNTNWYKMCVYMSYPIICIRVYHPLKEIII